MTAACARTADAYVRFHCVCLVKMGGYHRFHDVDTFSTAYHRFFTTFIRFLRGTLVFLQRLIVFLRGYINFDEGRHSFATAFVQYLIAPEVEFSFSYRPT